MPRLTNQQYLANGRWLNGVWNSNLKCLFALLTLQQQLDLHAYFAPTKDWTDEERIEHRQVISKEFSDLPSKAGRYCSRVGELYDEAVEFSKGNDHLIRPYISDSVAPLKIDQSGRMIGIAAVARPKPDLRGFAKALIQLAQLQEQEEVESKDAA